MGVIIDTLIFTTIAIFSFLSFFNMRPNIMALIILGKFVFGGHIRIFGIL